MDIFNSIQDNSQPLTVHEYEEWGSPAIPDELEYIKTYCPYRNIGGKQGFINVKPKIYVSVSLHDNNVPPLDVLNWVDKLRKHRSNICIPHQGTDNVNEFYGIFLRIIADADHFGPRCLEDRYLERAHEMSFLNYVINTPN